MVSTVTFLSGGAIICFWTASQLSVLPSTVCRQRGLDGDDHAVKPCPKLLFAYCDLRLENGCQQTAVTRSCSTYVQCFLCNLSPHCPHKHFARRVCSEQGGCPPEKNMQTCSLSDKASPNSPKPLDFCADYCTLSEAVFVLDHLGSVTHLNSTCLSSIYKGPQSSKRMQSRHLRSRSLKVMTSPRR